MKGFRYTLLALGILLLIVGIGGWIYYKQQYPYGRTHRCSKNLALDLSGYASRHGGKFPSSDNPKALGLSALIDDHPHSFDLVVGKAGDLDEAHEFYDKNGYLLPEHSSWHYVEGLTVNDSGALAWDKIPLGHNGQKQESNSREVIMTDGSVRVVKGKEWPEFLSTQYERSATQ